MLTAGAGFEDRLRSFVGLSGEVIGASVWIDLGQKKKQSIKETRLCLVGPTVLSLLAVLLERERPLSLLCRPRVCWESEVIKTPFVSVSSSVVSWLVVLNTKGTRQSPIMSDKISRKMIAEIIAASRGKRMARPLQVQDKTHELRHCISGRGVSPDTMRYSKTVKRRWYYAKFLTLTGTQQFPVIMSANFNPCK